MKKLFLLLLPVTFLISCQKANTGNTVQPDYLVFGHFYGMCQGEECIETFKLTDDQLYEDKVDDYTGQQLVFVQLDESKFNKVRDLPNYFPAELLNSYQSVFGCPDCADGGGLFIQYYQNGQLRSWRIDQVKSNVPAYLHDFMDKVNQKIALINS